jgi:hypothetical protein
MEEWEQKYHAEHKTALELDKDNQRLQADIAAQRASSAAQLATSEMRIVELRSELEKEFRKRTELENTCKKYAK